LCPVQKENDFVFHDFVINQPKLMNIAGNPAKRKAHRFPVPPLQWDQAAPLTAEHELISQLLSETLRGGWRYYQDLELDATEAGQKVLAAEPASCARLVLALVAHLSHYDSLRKKVCALAKDEMERINWHLAAEWEAIWFPRTAAEKVLRRLLRRKLPLTREHLLALAEWIAAADWINDTHFPLKAFVADVDAHGPVASDDARLRAALAQAAKLFRNDHSKDTPKLAHRLEAFLGKGASEPGARTPSSARSEQMLPGEAFPDPFKPAPVGSPQILVQLKQYLGVLPADSADVGTEEVGLDRFSLRGDSPLRAEHELISMFLPEVVGSQRYTDPDLTESATGQALVCRDSLANGRLLFALAERCANIHFSENRGLIEDYRHWQAQHAVSAVFGQILRREPRLSRDELFDVLLFLSALSEYRWTVNLGSVEKLVGQIAQLPHKTPFSVGERHVLHRVRCLSVRTCPFGRPSQDVTHITELLEDSFFLALVPAEAWADAVNAELAAMPATVREKWIGLLQHAAAATGARPSAKWTKLAKEHLAGVGVEKLTPALRRWLPLLNVPRTIRLLGGGMMSRTDLSGTIHEDNATVLRGLLWLAPEVPSAELIRLVGAATASCYRKIPGIGPRAVKVGNAGVYALSQNNDPAAVGQLALLKVKVKFGSAQKEIEKAFNVAADRAGLSREEIEEMSVPAYGLTDVGVAKSAWASLPRV
jgi:hypothetical protein